MMCNYYESNAERYAAETFSADMSEQYRRFLPLLKDGAKILDVGSGRGVFLFPFLEEFPKTETVSIDVLPRRVEFLQDVNRGGITRLRAVQADLCGQPFPDGSFDVVTALEVLEHIPDVESAVRAAVRMARRYVVVTVPSKPDDNPEHIHLLTKERLTELFEAAGCRRLHFDGVPGHLFVAAPLGKEG